MQEEKKRGIKRHPQATLHVVVSMGEGNKRGKKKRRRDTYRLGRSEEQSSNDNHNQIDRWILFVCACTLQVVLMLSA